MSTIYDYNFVSVGELLNAILNVRRVPTTPQVIGANIYVLFAEFVKMMVERYFWKKVL
jgi:hypothetical protein